MDEPILDTTTANVMLQCLNLVPPGKVLYLGLDTKPSIDNDGNYDHVVEYTFAYKVNGWTLEEANAATRQKLIERGNIDWAHLTIPTTEEKTHG